MKLPISKIKAKAWALFSIYIRLRDCDRVQKGGMYCPCITCGTVCHFKDLQAGHFLQGRGNAILFDEESVFAQCKQCNIFKHGFSDAYWPVMLTRYGYDKCMALVQRKHSSVLLTYQDYEALIEKYRAKIDELGGKDLRPNVPAQAKLPFKKKIKKDMTKGMKFPKVK